MDEGTKLIQYLCHLFLELVITDNNQPTLILYNDNLGAIDWTKTGNVATKKTSHLNIREMAVLEAKSEGKIIPQHIPGVTNPSDLSLQKNTRTKPNSSLVTLH